MISYANRTYILPQDIKLLRQIWPKYSQRNVKWIIKPPASARGTGIKVVNRWSQIPKRKPLIVQRYVLIIIKYFLTLLKYFFDL